MTSEQARTRVSRAGALLLALLAVAAVAMLAVANVRASAQVWAPGWDAFNCGSLRDPRTPKMEAAPGHSVWEPHSTARRLVEMCDDQRAQRADEVRLEVVGGAALALMALPLALMIGSRPTRP
jgi:hypothetical protein